MSDSWSTQPADASSGVPGPDILSSDQPTPRGRRRTAVSIVAAVAAVALVGTGAAYAAGAFGGGGTRPEQLVPATAIGYASVDLDPSLGQKVDALRFLRRFPSARSSIAGTDDLRRWAFEQVSQDDPALARLSYATDVQPWLGDRLAVALVPGAGGGTAAKGAPEALVVIQVKDESKARAALAKPPLGPGHGTCSVADGYAVCARTSAVLRAARAAATKSSLASSASFTSDVKRAGSPGVALVWGDLGRLGAALPQVAAGALRSASGSPLTGLLGGAGPLGALGALGDAGGLGRLGGRSGHGSTGRLVAVLRFHGADLEVTARSIGVRASAAAATPGTGVESLPDATMAAVGLTSDPAQVDAAYSALLTRLKATGMGAQVGAFESQLGQLGFHLPADVNAVLGHRLALAYAGTGPDGLPLVGLRGDAAAPGAAAVFDRVDHTVAGFGLPLSVRHVSAPDGYAAALTEPYARTLAAGGHLGASARFRAAVPDAASANEVVYVDVAALTRAGAIPGVATSPSPDLKALDAVGLSVSRAADGSSALRLEVSTR